MLARRLPGESLTRAWLRASASTRERLAAAFADLLREIHAERFPACGGFEAGELRPALSWQHYFAVRFERRLRIVRSCARADQALLRAIERRWQRHAPALRASSESNDPRL